MPYIKQEDRKKFEEILKLVNETPIDTVGDLNFLVTSICLKYFSQEKENYERHNAVIGVLECAKNEWYRMRTVPYENIKIDENGDV